MRKMFLLGLLGIAFASVVLAQDTIITNTPGGLFVPITPCRMVDTRAASGYPGQYGTPNVTPGTVRSFHVATGPIVSGQFGCGVPVGALGISYNVTVDDLDSSPTYYSVPRGFGKWGDLRIYPAGGPIPFVSILNWTLFTNVVANSGVVPLSPTGDVSVLVDGFGTYGADVIIDINGYFVPGVTQAALIGGVVTCPVSGATLWSICNSNGLAVNDARIKAGMVVVGTYQNTSASDTQIPIRIYNIHDGGFTAQFQSGTGFQWIATNP